MFDEITDVTSFSNLSVDYRSPSPASVLVATLGVLENLDVPYVVLHGYERFPELSGSDVDICIDSAFGDRQVRKLLQDNAYTIGARVVSCRDGAILLVGETVERRTFFLRVDLSHDYGLNGLRFVSGREILAARRRHGAFHVPAAAHQLAGYLATAVIKGKFNPERTNRFSSLYRSDPVGSSKELGRLFAGAEHTLILQALSDNRWEQVVAVAPELRATLIARLRRWHLFDRLAQTVRKFTGRARRFVSPTGLSVVVLGPDGAGKSSVTDAIGGPDLLPIFDRSVCWGFVPPLHRLIGRKHGPSSEPHALPTRSLAGSLIKAGYWLAFSILSHPRTHLMKARGGLVLYDRHFVDILVDATRYRYNGPRWILQAIWAVIPKPDFVVLLDAPAEIIHQRKKELSTAETARQLEAYRKLVAKLPNGVILDANKPLVSVIQALNRLLLERIMNRDVSKDVSFRSSQRFAVADVERAMASNSVSSSKQQS